MATTLSNRERTRITRRPENSGTSRVVKKRYYNLPPPRNILGFRFTIDVRLDEKYIQYIHRGPLSKRLFFFFFLIFAHRIDEQM